MARRTKIQNKQSNFDSLLAELDQFSNSPLGAIFTELRQGLESVYQIFKLGGCEQSQYEAVFILTQSVFQLLPRDFNDRFWFDAQMIHAIKEHWNSGQTKLSHCVFPVNRDEWAHQGTFLHSGNLDHQGKVKAINVIHFPSDGTLNSINLLGYPFLHHELAHNLYYFDDAFFKRRFTEKLNALISKLRLQSISDHGTARKLSEQIRREIESYWNPAANHQNWAHEIAMDITSLYTCGPAYIAALSDQLDDERNNPYLLTQEHPPYAVRVEALILACRRLGWEKEASKLREVLHQWGRSPYQRQKDNHYVALTNSDLIADCVKAVLATCQHKNLPLCDKQTIKQVTNKIRQNEMPEWGTEVILTAWLKYEMTPHHYDSWEESVVNELLSSLTP